MSRNVNAAEAVAAVNSCIDFDKLITLPSAVREKFGFLLQKNRVKAVCFFTTCGFGLRVYKDPQRVTFDGDEVIIDQGGEAEFDVDLEGSWMRCPPDLYAKYLAAVQEGDWIVGNDTAKRFWSAEAVSDDGDHWTYRTAATRMTKDEAVRKATEVGGVAVRRG